MDVDAVRRLASDLRGAVVCAVEALAAGATDEAARLAPVRALLAQGADPGFELSTPPASRPRAEFVTPMISAVRAGDIALVRLLCAERREGTSDPMQTGALLTVALAVPAARFMIPELLAAGCDPGAPNGYGSTALHAAVGARADLATFQSLLAAPCLKPEALSAVDDFGSTALQLALRQNAPREIVDALLGAPGGKESLLAGEQRVLCDVYDMELAARMLALGASAVASENYGDPLCWLLDRGAPLSLITALLAAGGAPAQRWDNMRHPFVSALRSRKYWNKDEEAPLGLQVCNLLRDALRASGDTPPLQFSDPGRMWGACIHPAAVRWLVETREMPELPPDLGALCRAMLLGCTSKKADLRPIVRAFRQVGGARMQGYQGTYLQLFQTSTESYMLERLVQVLAAMVATASVHEVATAMHVVRAVADRAAAEAEEAAAAAAAAALDDEWRAKAAAAEAQKVAHQKILDDFVRVASLAVQSPDQSVRDLVLDLLRNPNYDNPRQCEDILRCAAERNAPEEPRSPFADLPPHNVRQTRNAQRVAAAFLAATYAASQHVISPELSESDAAARAAATGASFVQAVSEAVTAANAKDAEPAQHAPAADAADTAPSASPPPRVELRCVDGGEVVSAPAAAQRWLGYLRNLVDVDADADVPSTLLPLPVAREPLQLLVNLLEASPPPAQAASWLQEHAAELNDSIPLIHFMVTANILDAPQWVLWAAAEAMALALTSEGERKRARREHAR